jgi:hypothetical protein
MAKINLDLSKIKDAFKGLGFLRAYSVLILPAVIIVAGLLVLTGAILMGRSFRTMVSRQSIPMGSQIKSLEGREDSLLVAKQIEVEKAYEDAFEQDANVIESLSIESSQRELLSYDILPRPTGSSLLLFTKFGENFRNGISEQVKKANGGDCPSEGEFGAAGINKGSIRTAPMTGSNLGVKEQDKIADGICQERAKNISIYANPNDVSGYIFWERYQYKDLNSAVDDCWYWQHGYWIVQDIFDTAAAVNKGSSTVFSSPLKRVMRVGFTGLDKLYPGGSTQTIAQDRPKFVIKPEDQLTEACTARISNNDYNVMHFSFAVVLKADSILPFMKELCSGKEHRFEGFRGNETTRVFKHNQITILETNIRPVETGADEHKYYRYGYEPVKEVEFICEYIFGKKGYEAINPAMVNKPDEPAAGT